MAADASLDRWRPAAGSDERALAAARAAGLLADPDAALARGTLLRDISGRRTARLALPGLGDVLVKVERESSLEDRVRALFRPSRARAEWDAARHLASAGLPVPRPLLLAERHEGRGARTSVYVAEWLPERRTLQEALVLLDEPRARALLRRLGETLRRMHASGYDHRDLHMGNVLVGPDAGDGPALHLIDLHRGRLGPTPSAGRVRSALARLLAGLRAVRVEAPGRRQALLAGYLGRDDAAAVEALDRSLARPLDAFVQRHLRRHDRDAFEDGTGLFERERELGRGFRRRGASTPALERVLREHDVALAAHDARVLKDGRKSAVTRHGDFVVKEARARGPWARFKRLLAPWRLAWGHAHAHALERRGLGTARTLAFLHRGGRVFTVYEDLSAFPRLDHLAGRLWREGPRAHQVALRDASAAWLAHFHRIGVYHGDVKGVNVLVGGTPAAPGLFVVDTDRCRFFRRPVDHSRRVRNLAQLSASIPRVVTRTERLRWWRRYAADVGLRDDLRAVAPRVAALVARKLSVVDAPIE